MSGRLYLLHSDGYVIYRAKTDWDDGFPRHTCAISDYAFVTPAAHDALWHVLLGLDLYSFIETAQLPVDDPLRYVLSDGRQVRTKNLRDGLWVRPLDVPALLGARRYALEIDVVIAVEDDFFGDGRYRLQGGPDGAQCRSTDRAVDLTLDVATLGSIYLGGHRLRALAAAGLAGAAEPVMSRLDRAFLAERAPFHGTNF